MIRLEKLFLLKFIVILSDELYSFNLLYNEVLLIMDDELCSLQLALHFKIHNFLFIFLLDKIHIHSIL